MQTNKSQLPIDGRIAKFIAALKDHSAVIVTATPGSGKTTRLPPALLPHVTGKILVLEPRRLAAIAAAHRIAEENSWQLGHEVGYQVRFEDKTTAHTRLIFLTEALLTRKLLHDPELQNVSVVVLDEFHERSIHLDLALALLEELRELGRDIKLVILSATLDPKPLIQYLVDVAHIDVAHPIYPLKINHSESSQKLLTDQRFFAAANEIIRQASQSAKGDVLVFLPGLGEIERIKQICEPWAQQQNLLVYSLHGSLPLELQKQVLNRRSHRRIILSTNVAESSMTIDGVDTVVDTGLAKVMYHNHESGFSRLTLKRISFNSATQRAGRAARLGPGTCWRMWSPFDEKAMTESEASDVARIDLSESLLLLSALGVRNFHEFKWFEKPSPLALKKSVESLKQLGVFDNNNTLTEVGHIVASLPLHPRLGVLVAHALNGDNLNAGALIAALVQERDFLKPDTIESYLAENWECDVQLRLHLIEQQKKSIKNHDLIYDRLQNVLRTSQQIFTNANKHHSAKTQRVTVKELLFAAFNDRLCRRRDQSERGLMVGGRGVRLSKDSCVQQSEFFLALDGMDSPGQAETQISKACGLSKEEVLKLAHSQIHTSEEVQYNTEKKTFYLSRFRTFRDLPLDKPTLTPLSAEQMQDLLPKLMLAQLDEIRQSNENLKHWWQRWSFFHQQRGLPADSELTVAQLTQACQMACMGEKSLNTVQHKDLVYFFESVFDSKLVAEFNQEIPSHFIAPTGNKFIIHYSPTQAPYVEVRLQEVFGLKATPKVFQQKVSLVLHLLGPNYRPVQVTADILSFWQNGYHEVRKTMKARYPKHSWPEDPLTAEPKAKGPSQRRQ